MNFRAWILIGLLALTGAIPDRISAAEDAESAVRAGHALLDQWRVEEADAAADRLVKGRAGVSADAAALKARILFFQGRYDAAMEWLRKADDGGRNRSLKDFRDLVERTRQATAGFVAVESPHFIFRYANGPDRILVHYAKEVLERSYETLGDLFGYRPKEKVLVEIFPGREPFAQASLLSLKEIVNSGTVALCQYNRLMLISPASLVRGYNWMDTLSHEYVHYLLGRKSRNRVPLWINEGIAKYFEARWRGAESLEPLQQTVLARGLEKNHLVGLQEMMPSLAKLKNAEEVQLAFAQVTTMVEFMIRSRDEKNLVGLLDDLAEDPSFAAALESRYGWSLETFQEEWKTYVKGKSLVVIPGLRVLDFRYKEDHPGGEDERDYGDIEEKTARDLVFLGDLLKSRDYLDAAALEYRKAVRESTSLSPILHNKLAGAHILLKEYEEAENILKENLKYYPQFTTTLTQLGETLFLAGKLQPARESFERAVRLNPFNPHVHQRLIEIHRKLGDRPAAEKQSQLYKNME